MGEKINLEKREKLINVSLAIFSIITFGIFAKFDEIKKILSNDEKRENKQEIKYDEQGFITEIKNNGKLFKFQKGVLVKEEKL